MIGKARCMLNKGIEGYLTKGKIYDIFSQSQHSYFVLDDTRKLNKYSKARFEFTNVELEKLKKMGY